MGVYPYRTKGGRIMYVLYTRPGEKLYNTMEECGFMKYKRPHIIAAFNVDMYFNLVDVRHDEPQDST